MTTILLALLALATPTEWKYVQPLDVTQPGLVTASLSPATLNAARAGLEDLRILDEADHEVPYLLLRPSRRLASVIAPKKFAASLAGRKTVLVIETGAKHPLEAVTLETPASGFIKAVAVEGSNDQQSWQLLGAGQPVFRQPNGVGNLRVVFAEGNWPFLRVTVDDARTEAVPFTGAKLHALSGETAAAEPLPVTITDRTENGSQTRLTLDLGAANVRLASLRIETSEPLFARAVSVAVRQVQENAITEKVLARDTVYQVAVEGQPPTAHAAHGEVHQAVSRTGVEAERLDPSPDKGGVPDAPDVLQDPGPAAAEHVLVEERGQRSSLAARRHVAGPEVGYDRDPERLGQKRRLPDLESRGDAGRGQVDHGLAV